MSDKKTKVDCQLSILGTNKANAKVAEDLKIPDPEPALGERLIKDAITDNEEEDDPDVDQQENS